MDEPTMSAGHRSSWLAAPRLHLLIAGGGIVAALLLIGCIWIAAERPPTYADHVESLNIVVTHAKDESFLEEHVMKLGDEVFIHDTNYTIRLLDYVPDFYIDKETKEVNTRSSLPNNPAAKIALFPLAQDTAGRWAFRMTEGLHRQSGPGFVFQVGQIKMKPITP